MSHLLTNIWLFGNISSLFHFFLVSFGLNYLFIPRSVSTSTLILLYEIVQNQFVCVIGLRFKLPCSSFQSLCKGLATCPGGLGLTSHDRLQTSNKLKRIQKIHGCVLLVFLGGHLKKKLCLAALINEVSVQKIHKITEKKGAFHKFETISSSLLSLFETDCGQFANLCLCVPPFGGTVTFKVIFKFDLFICLFS